MGTDSNTDQLAAYAKEGPPEHGLPAIRRLRALLDEWEAYQVRAARARGWNWGEIGRVLGRSRQAVHARYRDVVERDPLPKPLTAWDIRTKKRELLEQRLTGAISEERWLVLTKELDDQLP